MSDETAFLAAIKSNPKDDTVRLVYADWLDEQSDPRASFVRLHLALRSVAPDHVQRPAGERELSVLRKGLAPEWLRVVEPERTETPPEFGRITHEWQYRDVLPGDTCEFNIEPQDTECDAWKTLCEEIERAAEDGRKVFRLSDILDQADLWRIVTLPPSIAKLKKVKKLSIGTSFLRRLPPEISEMTSLEGFDAYMLYHLHWYPFEITRCKQLKTSQISTRAVYGNFKYRPPFPLLEPGMFAGRPEPHVLPLKDNPGPPTRKCSVCDQPFLDRREQRVWISLKVASHDVLPLLVNACSQECIQQLPQPDKSAVQHPHRGGPDLVQPGTW